MKTLPFDDILDRSFTINNYIVLNSTHATDATEACDKLALYRIQDVIPYYFETKKEELDICFTVTNGRITL